MPGAKPAVAFARKGISASTWRAGGIFSESISKVSWKFLESFLKVSWKFLKCCLKVSWKYLESFLNVAWKFLGKIIFFRTNWILYTPTCCTAEESKICKYEYKMSSCWKSHTMYGKYVSSKTGDCCYKNYGDFFQTRCRLFWHRWIRGLTSHLL